MHLSSSGEEHALKWVVILHTKLVKVKTAYRPWVIMYRDEI